MKNTCWIIAGGLNFLTAILHALGGQMDLVNPLINSILTNQAKAEWIGGWHMITIILFGTSYLLLAYGWKYQKGKPDVLIQYIGYLYLLFALPFILSSLYFQLMAPQWILLFPIGALALWGNRK